MEHASAINFEYNTHTNNPPQIHTAVFLDQSSTSMKGTPEMRRESSSGVNILRHF